MNLCNLIGLKVVAVKGEFDEKKTKPEHIRPCYVLFNDGETIVEFEEQDMEYHDCASYARILNFRKDKKLYEQIMAYKDSKGDFFCH